MPKSLIVISDMEIDCSGNRDWTFYGKMAVRFAAGLPGGSTQADAAEIMRLRPMPLDPDDAPIKQCKENFAKTVDKYTWQ